MRRLLHAAVLLLIAGTAAPAAHAEYRYTVADTRAAMAGHSALARCIVTLESDDLDPYSVGAQGELGVAQLHPRGLLPEFYARGYDNPFSPYQSMDFLDWALEAGEGPQWTAWWYC